jgi:hypothetical protein
MNEQLHTGRITQKQQKGTALCPGSGFILIRRPLILGQYDEVFNDGTVVDQC